MYKNNLGLMLSKMSKLMKNYNSVKLKSRKLKVNENSH